MTTSLPLHGFFPCWYDSKGWGFQGADDDTADALTLLSDVVACIVSSCMLTQQQVEIEAIKDPLPLE